MQPVAEVAALAELPDGRGSRAVGGLLGVRGGLVFARHLGLELAGAGGVDGEGAGLLHAGADVRAWLRPPDVAAGSFSLLLGGGLGLTEGLGGELRAGLAGEVPVGPHLAPRLSSTWTWQPGEGARVAVGLGLSWRPAPPDEPVAPPPAAPPPVTPPPEPVAPPPAPPPAGPTLEVVDAPPGTTVWVPHPWCQWMRLDEARRLAPSLPPGTRLEVVAPGFLPARTQLGVDGAVALTPAPPQGSLVLVGFPGDVVTVGGTTLRLDAEGVLLLNVPAGPLDVHAEGAGRAVDRHVGIGVGEATWLRLPEPEPVVVHFPVGSARAAAAELGPLRELAARLGQADLVVSGSYSPEGDPVTNAALARERAEAVRAELLRLGVPAARVRVEDHGPSEGGDPEELRVAVVRAVPGGGAP